LADLLLLENFFELQADHRYSLSGLLLTMHTIQGTFALTQ
jgi:hypothetical protein